MPEPEELTSEDISGWDYLKRLEAYIASLVDIGTYTTEMADEIWWDNYNRLFAQGKYATRQKVFELPDFNKVGTYISGLHKAEQTRIEKEAKYFAQQQAGMERYGAEVQQDILRQQATLPLGRGGTASQQIWTAEHTIAGLQKQLTASPHLAKTIEDQVKKLRDFQNQQAELTGMEARAKMQEEAEPFTEQPRISFGRETLAFAEKYGMSPARAVGLAEKFGGGERGVGEFADITQEQGRELRAVAGEAYEEGPFPERPAAPESYKPPSFKEAGITGALNWRDWFENRFQSVVSEFGGQAERTEESWAELLQRREAELKGEYYQKSPYERGERPSAFAPKIRTVRW